MKKETMHDRSADVIELGHSSQPSRFPRPSSAKHTHFSRPLFVAAANMDHVFWMATLRKTMVSLSRERDCRVSRSNGPAAWISACKSDLRHPPPLPRASFRTIPTAISLSTSNNSLIVTGLWFTYSYIGAYACACAYILKQMYHAPY